MRKLYCRDVSGRDCDWEFIGESDDEVIAKASEHDQKMHAFRPTEEQEKRMREAIRS